MLDEIIVTETPPLYYCYGRRGAQVSVPITGNRSKRSLHAALNMQTGELLLFITEVWDALTPQYFLEMIRRHWRGWHLILFEDRGSPHTAEDSLETAAALNLEVRLLPRACPELNAADHLFRSVKGRALANRQTQPIEASADSACRYLYALSRQERLVKAGVLSGNFWLTC
ncbi:MAG: transposase [Acidobacteria bacterium]|nr:transposase [Acidobacteriota bacterium]MBI3425240.1 transposase [Acidobacteriota bacterium]